MAQPGFASASGQNKKSNPSESCVCQQCYKYRKFFTIMQALILFSQPKISETAPDNFILL